MSFLNRESAVDSARKRRGKNDVQTGGWIICPGSFFPKRTGVLVEGTLIHAVPVKKRSRYHAMCAQCGIQFQLNNQNWKHFQVFPRFCGSDTPIPGVSLSKPEAAILMEHLTNAKINAIEEWQEKIWLNLNPAPISLSQVSTQNQIVETQAKDPKVTFPLSQGNLGQDQEQEDK